MDLSPSQRIATDRFIANETHGCFDVPGAGKTAVAINAIGEIDQYPALVTLPAHLIPQWKGELIRWGVPESEIAATPRGTGPAKRLAALTGDKAITLVSYNTWASWSYIPALLDPRWQSFTFDEFHRLRKARRSRKGVSAWESIKWLRTKTRSVHLHTPIWALTGTPEVSNAGDFFPFLALAAPDKFTSKRAFVLRWCHTTETPYGLDVGKLYEPARFRTMLGKYSIRRRWHEIPELAQLERRDIELPVELDARTLKRHRYMKKNYRDPVTNEPFASSGALVVALRRMTMDAKLDTVREFVADTPGRLIVLAWYREAVQRTLRCLSKSGRNVVAIHGGTSEPNRKRALTTYEQHSDTVLIGTIGSLKEGWNLQSGHQVVFIEQHYLGSDNEQAVFRAMRRGQTETVRVWWIYAEKSIDTRVRRIASRRSERIYHDIDAELVGGDDYD